MPQKDVLALNRTDYAMRTGRPSWDISRIPALSSRDAVAGAAGGVVSVLLGQPFDLVKVRLQAANSSDVLRTIKDIWTHEGPLAFYNGAALPFLGVGLAVSIQFTTFHTLRKALQDRSSGRRLSTFQSYLCGGGAGIANSIISGPVEHIRTRLQLQSRGAARLYSGPLDCTRQIFAKGGIPGLFKAYPTAVAREFQAYGCYFAAFEVSKTALKTMRGRDSYEMSIWETIPCGALAGIAFWVGSYPMDVVKTKLQSDGFGSSAKYRTAWSAAACTWRQGRFLGFWRGLAPTLVRTALSSAGCFTAVEQVRNLL